MVTKNELKKIRKKQSKINQKGIVITQDEGLRPIKELTKHFSARTDDSHETAPARIKKINRQSINN